MEDSIKKQLYILFKCFRILCSSSLDSEARDLLELTEARYKTIFCSQFDGWHQKIGEATLADAICDRIVHDSYRIVIGGEDSMRKRKGISEND